MIFDLVSTVELTASAAVVIATVIVLFGHGVRKRALIGGGLAIWFTCVLWAGAAGVLHNDPGFGTRRWASGSGSGRRAQPDCPGHFEIPSKNFRYAVAAAHCSAGTARAGHLLCAALRSRSPSGAVRARRRVG